MSSFTCASPACYPYAKRAAQDAGMPYLLSPSPTCSHPLTRTACIALLCTVLAVPATGQAQAANPTPTPSAAPATTSGLPDMTRIAAKLSPSVVNISVRGVRKVSTAEDAIGYRSRHGRLAR